jgi:S1-C subfamily serine protease
MRLHPVALLVALAVLVAPLGASARPGTWPPKAKQRARANWAFLQKRVAQATVMLPDRGCAGVVVRSARLVATAAHCVPEGARELSVVLPGGKAGTGAVGYLDRNADLALLVLAQPARIQPLQLASALPRRGTRLLFVGRTDRPSRAQLTRVERLDRCPSLPLLGHAVFTSLDARPGDSGAPLVDAAGRVVALVHGGARCEIAVPAAALAKAKLAPPPVEAPVAPGEPTRPTLGDQNDVVFERTPHGFRFHWSFQWQSGD